MPTRRTLLKIMAGAAALGAGGWGALRPASVNAYYSGPVTDHFDGVRFSNLGGPNPKGFFSLARMYTDGSWTPWPSHFPSPYVDRPPARVDGAKVRMAYVGHASFLVQTAGINILLDPVWSDVAGPFRLIGPSRKQAPGIAFDDLPRIDWVLVTHNHYDHLDLATLERLWRRDSVRVVTPLGNDAIMREAIPNAEITIGDWGSRVSLAPGVVVHLEPSQHWSARGTRDRRHALWASFVIETPAGKIYAVGDSGFGDGRTFVRVAERHPGLRLALLPIGAYEPRWFMAGQHMNPSEAVRAMQLSGAEAALGHHWGTFRLTAEAIDEPPRKLAEALQEARIAPERFKALRPGQVAEIAVG
jgi:L-ascorbate metabolism protein UlaG (beta-lactamase superfamily)